MLMVIKSLDISSLVTENTAQTQRSRCGMGSQGHPMKRPGPCVVSRVSCLASSPHSRYVSSYRALGK